MQLHSGNSVPQNVGLGRSSPLTRVSECLGNNPEMSSFKNLIITSSQVKQGSANQGLQTVVRDCQLSRGKMRQKEVKKR